MHRTIWPCLIVALAVLPISVIAAPAQVLVNKPLSQNGAWVSNIFRDTQQMADDITLSAPAIANNLTWYGTFQPSANFRVRFFADVATSPANSPFYDQSLGFLTGVDTELNDRFGRDIFEYSSPIPPVALVGSTRYWLSIASTDSAEWAWSHANAGQFGNDSFSRYGESVSWQSLISYGWSGDSLEKAFKLEGVPEPSSRTLTGILLAAFAPYIASFRYVFVTGTR